MIFLKVFAYLLFGFCLVAVSVAVICIAYVLVWDFVEAVKQQKRGKK